MLSSSSLYLLRALAASSLLTSIHGATLTVSTTGGNASSPILYGLMFEDINHSSDGGLHGQLLMNNGFQGTNPGLVAYAAVGDTTLSQDTTQPLSSAINSSLKVSVPDTASGMVGFSNNGYLTSEGGLTVNADTYANYFFIKGDYSGTITLRLVGNSSGIVYASHNVTVTSNSTAWTYVETSFTSTQSPDGNNLWQLLFDSSQVQGSALWFDLVQLFPTTFHARYNGLKNDVANFLQAVEGSFLRFPGGANLEGTTPADRWKWNETIGPVQVRPGRQGDWGYPNTDALGLMEYLQWCEDMSLTPVLAIWDGLPGSGTGIISGSALTPYVDDALDELHFLFDDTTTALGALRASYGHPAPYNVSHVEIGNEDNLANGCSTYPSRCTAFYDAIHEAFPALNVITSTADTTCLPSPLPSGVWTDIHHYEPPSGFISLFSEFDNAARTAGAGIFVGEYACHNTDAGAGIPFSTVQTATSEAVYMIGLERNSDIVKMASYAPLLEHFGLNQWSPDLVGLDARPGSLTGSVSYYVQKMFSTTRGDTIRPVSADVGFGPLYWVASSKGEGEYIVKVANYGNVTENVTVAIPAATGLPGAAEVQILTGEANASNQTLNVTALPVSSTVEGSVKEGWTFELPGYGVAVFTVGS